MSIQDRLNAAKLIGQTINQKLYITGLNDTPTGYLGHSGDYLVVNDGESGIHFTGIEKIANDLMDYGFGGGSLDIPKYTNLPDPEPFDGKIVASGCDLYYGCDGEWKKVGADAIPPPENIPGCISNLQEYNQYQEYKDGIIEFHQADAIDKALNGNSFDFFLSDVCLFKEVSNPNGNESLCQTKVIESNYKWAIVENGNTINIKAEVLSANSLGLEFALQSNTSDGSLDFVDSGAYQFNITNPDNTVSHSSSVTKYGSTSVFFDNGFLDTNEIAPFNFMHTNTEYSLGFWVNGKISQNSDRYIISTSALGNSQKGFRAVIVNQKMFFSVNGSPATHKTITSANTLNDDEWYYVKVISHLDNDIWKLSMYVNGELSASIDRGISPYTLSDNSAYSLSMGVNKYTTKRLLNIYLQDLVIFKGNLDPATFTDVPTTLTPVSVNPDEEVNCSFVNWKTSDNSIIGDVNSSETTALINNDVSITGVFQC